MRVPDKRAFVQASSGAKSKYTTPDRALKIWVSPKIWTIFPASGRKIFKPKFVSLCFENCPRNDRVNLLTVREKEIFEFKKSAESLLVRA